jgi:hypothetical protein
MDALKEIPQIFFDLIARVIPGLLALFVLDCDGVLQWSRVVSSVSGSRSQESNSFGLSLLIAIAAAYLIGHMLSLISKQLESLADYSGFTYRAVKNIEKDLHRPPVSWAEVSLEAEEVRKKDWTSNDEIWQKYDWLRVNKPSAGSLAVRMRAEYTMYFSVCAVLLLTVLGPNLKYITFYVPWRFVLVFTAVLTLHRAHDLKQKFAGSVRKLYRAANSALLNKTVGA